MSARRDLILAPLTLGRPTPPALVAVAAAAGFDGVTIDLSRPASGVTGVDPFPMDSGPMLTDTERRLADSGLYVLDIQAVRPHRGLDIAALAPMFAIGQRLGARHVMTVVDEPDEACATDLLAALAEAARPYGLAIGVEFMVYGAVRDLAQAWRMVGRAGAANLNVIVDTLHLARSDGSATDLAAIPPARMPYLQLCDAPRAAPGTTREALRGEALRGRLFPGDGALDLAGMIAAAPAGKPLVVEVPTAETYPGLGPDEIAARAIAATRRLCGAMEDTEC